MNEANWAYQQQLGQARKIFAEGGPVPDHLLAPPVLRSWERLRAAGVVQHETPDFEEEWARRPALEDSGDRRFARHAQHELDQLWGAFGGRNWSMLCINSEGTVLATRAHELCARQTKQTIPIGARLSEVKLGTNAPSCVIAENAPVLLRQNEHYLDCYTSMFCLSVPLHGPGGELLGALGISGADERDPDVLLDYLKQAALSIESHQMQDFRSCHLLALQYDGRLLNTPLQGMLAVEEDGSIREANRTARRLLGLPNTGALPVVTLRDVFAEANVHQRRRLLQSGPARRIRLSESSALQVQHMRGPVSARGSTAIPLSAMDASHMSLRAQGVHAVHEAMASHHGNVSAAARMLGISRTTLYRKLQQSD